MWDLKIVGSGEQEGIMGGIWTNAAFSTHKRNLDLVICLHYLSTFTFT